MSIRTDLIPKAYAVELRKLQDKIPPFDNNLAKEIMRQQLKVFLFYRILLFTLQILITKAL